MKKTRNIYLGLLFFLVFVFLGNKQNTLAKTFEKTCDEDQCILKIHSQIDSFIVSQITNEVYTASKDNIKLVYLITFDENNSIDTLEIKKMKSIPIDSIELTNFLNSIDYSCIRQTGIYEVDSGRRFYVTYFPKAIENFRRSKK